MTASSNIKDQGKKFKNEAERCSTTNFRRFNEALLVPRVIQLLSPLECLTMMAYRWKSSNHNCKIGDAEISFLRQEVTRCTNDVLVASQTSNKRNSDELLTWPLSEYCNVINDFKFVDFFNGKATGRYPGPPLHLKPAVLRKGNSDQVAITIDMDSAKKTSRLDDEEDDKGEMRIRIQDFGLLTT
ncbi:hypothetical protein ACE6H2_004603 [Prunus campanulata]